jgi:hypothetical protein
MSIDDLMIAIIIGGIGLTAAYLRAEFMSWRSGNAAERRKKAGLRAGSTSHRYAAARLPMFRVFF